MFSYTCFIIAFCYKLKETLNPSLNNHNVMKLGLKLIITCQHIQHFDCNTLFGNSYNGSSDLKSQDL